MCRSSRFNEVRGLCHADGRSPEGLSVGRIRLKCRDVSLWPVLGSVDREDPDIGTNINDVLYPLQPWSEFSWSLVFAPEANLIERFAVILRSEVEHAARTQLKGVPFVTPA